MKKVVVTRMYDFDYFHSFFFHYYLSQGFDFIVVYAKKKHFDVILKSISSSKIILKELPDYAFPLTFAKEHKLCNFIYRQTLDFYISDFKNEEVLVFFADDDEYYQDITPDQNITRSIFFEFYLEKNTILSANEFYKSINSEFCRGKILALWNDIYYKEAVLKLTPESIILFKDYTYSNAFHRVLSNKTVLNIKKDETIVFHLKGIPHNMQKKRIKQKTKKILNNDDWCSNHYLFEEKIINNYTKFYNSLAILPELYNQLKERKLQLKKEESFFEKHVIPREFISENENKPSFFFTIK